MARNTRMPDDVAELTAAWKRHHDEMERGVKFVGRGEAKTKPKAELRASRGGMPPQTLATALGAEIDPTEEAKKAYRAAANGEVDMPLVSPGAARIIGAGLAGYQGVEAVAGAVGVGARANPPRVAPGGKLLLSAGHILSGSDFMNATKSGVLVQPSIALSRAGMGFPLSEAYAGRQGSGYPDVIIKIPETLIKGNPRAAWSNTDLGSPTIRSIFDFVEQARDTGKLEGTVVEPMGGGIHRMNVEVPPILFSGSPEQVLSTKEGRDAFHLFRDTIIKKLYPSTAAAMNPNIGELGDRPLSIMNGAQIVGDVPVEFSESIQSGEMYSSPYGEIKILGDLPLSEIWKSGNGVILRTPRDGALDRTKVKEMIQYLRDNDVPFETETPYNPFDKNNIQRGRDHYRDIGNDFVRLITNVDTEVMAAAKGGRTVHAAEGGGDAGSETAVSETPVSEAPAQPAGPRIVINPQVFRDRRDALCVTFNEAFRLVMEENGFEPVSEPTEKQRRFFADTAYADDELQLRRTILARIATLDTSVSDPTDEQLEETAEMLEMVMEVGAPQNEWEQQAVQRLHDVVVKGREGRVPTEEAPPPPQDEASTQADVGGGVTDDENEAWDELHKALTASTAGMAEDHAPAAQEPRGPAVGDVRYLEKDGTYVKQTYGEHGWNGQIIQKDEWDAAQKSMQGGTSANETAKAWDEGAGDRKVLRENQAAAREGRLATMNLMNAAVADGSVDRLAWRTEKSNQDKFVEQGRISAMTPEQHLAWHRQRTAMRRSSTAEPGPNQGPTSINPPSEPLDVQGAATAVYHVHNATKTVAAVTPGAAGARLLYDMATSPMRPAAKSAVTRVLGGMGRAAAAAGFAKGGIESAYHGAAGLLSTAKATGASWGDVGNATKDVFTTRQGWKNLGWGLLGSTHDVLGSMTFGVLGNGDRWRNRMR